MKFENKGKNIHVAFVTRAYRNHRGEQKNVFSAVRVIRESVGQFRVDFCDAVAGAWLPFEPATTDVFPTSAKAKSAARKWLRTNA